jgi:hypothetical protein
MELAEKLDLVRGIAPAKTGLPKKSLLNLGVGSVIRAAAISQDLWMVERVYNYQETNQKGERKKYQWKEYMLRNLSDFSTRFFEVEDDDGLSAYITGDKVAQGKMSVAPNKSVKELSIRGVSDGPFYQEEFCSAVFDGDNGDEYVTLLDYESDNGKMLGVEIWEDGNCEAYFYEELKMKGIELISLGN